jgi:hypothetical protein
LLQCALVDIPNLCSNRFEKTLLPNINNDAKPRMVCSQEGEKGIDCLHIKFTLAEDVFQSMMTQKQGENDEYMFESMTTQMQEGENDEDITNMDTPLVMAYDSKVKLFFTIVIFNTCDEWTLHYVFSVTYRSTYMDQGRRGSCMKRMFYETPGLGTKYKCNLRSHQVTTLLVV